MATPAFCFDLPIPAVFGSNYDGRALEILGEAVRRLPPELCEAYPNVPWRLVAGMRDRLSHGYDEVDYEILRNAVHQDLPNLLKTVDQMIIDLE